MSVPRQHCCSLLWLRGKALVRRQRLRTAQDLRLPAAGCSALCLNSMLGL